MSLGLLIFEGINSSREIVRLSKYDPAYQWLTGMRPVNHHTLADFRSIHADSLHRLFVEILAVLSSEGFITMERVMHDGTKIKASAEHFLFDPAINTYICPEGKSLVSRGKSVQKGKTTYLYRGKECKSCPSKSSCCPHAANGRSIGRMGNDPVVEAFYAKMKTEEARAIYKQRGPVAEFPNAWIKQKFGLRQFHLRGLVKVELEALWAAITYNIKIWIRLRWRPRFQMG